MKPQSFVYPDWQTSLKNAVTDPAELLDLLALPKSLLAGAEQASKLFPLRVPREFIARMEPENPRDPLLLQVLPLLNEFEQPNGYIEDPLQEANSNPTPGIVHKYQDRVLLILSGACAVNCRYCFRRHYPYEENQFSGEQWNRGIDYIRADHRINEVILSGGDPFLSSDKRLAKIIEELEQIEHIERLRIHTRFPVVIPSRITEPLAELLSASRLQTLIVFHINHPNEIDEQLSAALARLKTKDITLLNQAVVLKGINDSSETQISLSRKLFNNSVLPYYLFLFDPVKGASHFDAGPKQAEEIFAEMQAALPGYLVPKLAKEIPGRKSKTLIQIKQTG